MVKKEVSFTDIFLQRKRGHCFFAWPKASKQPIPTQLPLYRRRRLNERVHVCQISLDEISLKCEASESVQFSTCHDLVHRFQRVKVKSSFFSKIKTYLRKKKYTVFLVFLVLLGSTCVQNLRQFEFLTLAIKISYLVSTTQQKTQQCTPNKFIQGSLPRTNPRHIQPEACIHTFATDIPYTILI